MFRNYVINKEKRLDLEAWHRVICGAEWPPGLGIFMVPFEISQGIEWAIGVDAAHYEGFDSGFFERRWQGLMG